MRKPGMTLEEHRELGRELRAMRRRLVKLSVMVSGKYLLSGPAPYKLLDKAHKAIQDFAYRMEGQCERDCPGIEEADLMRVYLGEEQ